MRSGPSHSGSDTCLFCRGRGRARAPRSAAIAALRELRAVLAGGAPNGVELVTSPAIADELDVRASEIRALEDRHGVTVRIHADSVMAQDRFEVVRLSPARRN
jgi:Ribonuclease G/E